MTRRILIALTAAASLASSYAHAGVTNEAYTAGPIGDLINECRQDNPAGINIAAACVAATSGQSVAVKVTDDLLDSIDFFWTFENSAGDCPGIDPDDPLADCPYDGFAVDHVNLVAPPGSARLKILLSGPVFATLDDANSATMGKVAFTK
jgi:hypothetical protein